MKSSSMKNLKKQDLVSKRISLCYCATIIQEMIDHTTIRWLYTPIIEPKSLDTCITVIPIGWPLDMLGIQTHPHNVKSVLVLNKGHKTLTWGMIQQWLLMALSLWLISGSISLGLLLFILGTHNNHTLPIITQQSLSTLLFGIAKLSDDKSARNISTQDVMYQKVSTDQSKLFWRRMGQKGLFCDSQNSLFNFWA